MKRVPFIFSTLCLLAAATTLSAQQLATPPLPLYSPAVDASMENSRLRQMETIYQEQLRLRHIPLLGRYLTTLHNLAQISANPLPYQNEIARIQTIIGNGGVVDLTAASQALRAPAQIPTPSATLLSRRFNRTLHTLTPSLASRIQPPPSGSSSPEAAAVGTVEWRLGTLPAGSYELLLRYACPKLDAPLPVQVQFAGQTLNIELSTDHVTRDATSFLPLSLGRFVLDKETPGGLLIFQAGTPDGTTLWLKQLLLIKNRANP
jgi:hypothetical protein